MGNAITQESRAVWLAMLRNGGWWTVKNLVHHWAPTFAEFELQDIVAGLVASGFAARREIAPGVTAFAVTSECTPLPGQESQVDA